MKASMLFKTWCRKCLQKKEKAPFTISQSLLGSLIWSDKVHSRSPLTPRQRPSDVLPPLQCGGCWTQKRIKYLGTAELQTFQIWAVEDFCWISISKTIYIYTYICVYTQNHIDSYSILQSNNIKTKETNIQRSTIKQVRYQSCFLVYEFCGSKGLEKSSAMIGPVLSLVWPG